MATRLKKCLVQTCAGGKRLTPCLGPKLLEKLLDLQQQNTTLSKEQADELEEEVRTERGNDCLSGPGSVFHQECLGRDAGLAWTSNLFQWDKDKQKCTVRDVRHWACNPCLARVTDKTDVKYTDASEDRLEQVARKRQTRYISKVKNSCKDKLKKAHQLGEEAGLEFVTFLFNPQMGGQILTSPLVESILAKDEGLRRLMHEVQEALEAAVRRKQSRLQWGLIARKSYRKARQSLARRGSDSASTGSSGDGSSASGDGDSESDSGDASSSSSSSGDSPRGRQEEPCGRGRGLRCGKGKAGRARSQAPPDAKGSASAGAAAGLQPTLPQPPQAPPQRPRRQAAAGVAAAIAAAAGAAPRSPALAPPPKPLPAPAAKPVRKADTRLFKASKMGGVTFYEECWYGSSLPSFRWNWKVDDNMESPPERKRPKKQYSPDHFKNLRPRLGKKSAAPQSAAAVADN